MKDETSTANGGTCKTDNGEGSPLDLKTTLYQSATDTEGRDATIGECLLLIREDKRLANMIPKLRPLYVSDPKGYDERKKKLPAFTFSGSFTKRGIEGLAIYSGVIQADLDKLKSKGIAIADLRKRMETAPHTLFCFASPSGDGLKVGVKVDATAADHLEAFRGMQRYFEHSYGVRPDDACKDVSRLCFLSSDPDVFTNEHATVLDWKAWPEPEVEFIDDQEDEADQLPLDAFPEIIQQLSSACAKVYQVDPALPAVAALTIMAASLGNTVRCVGAVSGRETPANLFTVLAAPSGYGKGVVGVVARPLTDACTEMIERFEQIERPRLKADILIAGEKRKKIMADLKADGLTPAAEEVLRERLVGIERQIEADTFNSSQMPVLYTGSATGAALGLALKRNDEQLLSLALEAGDAIRVAAGRFSSDNHGDYDLMLSGYTGEPFNDARVSRVPLRLKAPCLSVLWAVQPSLMRELYGTAEAQERGLLARINVVSCDDDVTPHDDGVFRDVPAAVSDSWDAIVRAALSLRQKRVAKVFRADRGASEIFRQWHNEAVDLKNGDGRENEAKLKRCRENAIRIATVIASADWMMAGGRDGDHPLTAEHAARGVAIARYFTNIALRLTSGAVAEKRNQRLADVVKHLVNAGGQTTLRAMRNSHGVGETEIRQIVARNPKTLKIEETKPGPKGGRPSPRLSLITGAK